MRVSLLVGFFVYCGSTLAGEGDVDVKAFRAVVAKAVPAYRSLLAYCEISKRGKVPLDLEGAVTALKQQQSESLPVWEDAKNFFKGFMLTPEHAVIALIEGVAHGLPLLAEMAIAYLSALPGIPRLLRLQPSENKDMKTVLASRVYRCFIQHAKLVTDNSIQGFLAALDGQKIPVLVLDMLLELVVRFAATPNGLALLGPWFGVRLLEMVARKDFFKRCPRLVVAATDLHLWSKRLPNVRPPLWYLACCSPNYSAIHTAITGMSAIEVAHMISTPLVGNVAVSGVVANKSIPFSAQYYLLTELYKKGCSLNNAKPENARRFGTLYHMLCKRIRQPGSIDEQKIAELIRRDAPSAALRLQKDQRGCTLCDLARARGLKLVLGVLG